MQLSSKLSWLYRADVWIAFAVVYLPATWILFRAIPLRGGLRWTYSLLVVTMFFGVMLVTVEALDAVVPALIEWIKNPTVLRRLGLPGVEAFLAFLPRRLHYWFAGYGFACFHRCRGQGMRSRSV